MTTGTDEATYGASADGNFKAADLSGAEALLPNNANSQNLWGQAFTCINTATGTGQAVSHGLGKWEVPAG